MSRNLTFSSELSIVEKLTYTPDPNQSDRTLLKQEAMITVHGVPLSSFIEEFIGNTISRNANKGRLAMEWVIDTINSEVQEITTKSKEGWKDLLLSHGPSPMVSSGLNPEV
jgi:hypothetical protein